MILNPVLSLIHRYVKGVPLNLRVHSACQNRLMSTSEMFFLCVLKFLHSFVCFEGHLSLSVSK